MLLLETGYRKALSLLAFQDITGIKDTLRDYYTIIRVKAEIDQFVNGTWSFKMYKAVSSQLMQPLFVASITPLSKRKCTQYNTLIYMGALLHHYNAVWFVTNLWDLFPKIITRFSGLAT